ncbi:MAG TPA: cellulase family glycosylhydrolase [Anaerolineaceae bacterium]|jgi:endoglucanase
MPRYGFNFLWMFSMQPGHPPAGVDRKAIDFLAELGFDFIRIPTDYRFWTQDFDYFHPDEAVFRQLDSYLEVCQSRGMQMCLNLHRAPGYCINRADLERHNLWLDKVAQDAFVFLWESFAHRYQGIPSEALSFDLLNEPPGVGDRGMTRENHAAVIRRAADAIRAIDPDREIVIDGIGGGGTAVPELADLGVIHSGRGYTPMPVSHYGAPWWSGSAGLNEPVYPGLRWEGKQWSLGTLRDYYEPWLEVEASGVRVHIGECGCFNRTPNDVAMRWFRDLLGLYREFGWGFSLWNFEGPFGIIEHGRPGAVFESYHGYNVDRALLDLILESRV